MSQAPHEGGASPTASGSPKPEPDGVAQLAPHLAELQLAAERAREVGGGASLAQPFAELAQVAARVGCLRAANALRTTSDELAQASLPGAAETALHALDAVAGLALSDADLDAARGFGRPPSSPPQTPDPLILAVPSAWADSWPPMPHQRVYSASSSEEMLALCRELSPDLILLDATRPAPPGMIGDLRRLGHPQPLLHAVTDLSKPDLARAWLREGVQPIALPTTARLLNEALGRSARRGLPLPAEPPFQRLLAVPRSAGTQTPHAQRELRSRRAVVLSSADLQSPCRAALEGAGLSVATATRADVALAQAHLTWPEVLLLCGPLGPSERSLVDAVMSDLVLSDVRIIHLAEPPGADQWSDEAWQRRLLAAVWKALQPRVALERLLKQEHAVKGRLDGLTPASLVEALARHRPNALLRVASGSQQFSLSLRAGRPRRLELYDAARSERGGAEASGFVALGLLLGVRSGRFVVESPDTQLRDDPELSGTLRDQLEPLTRRCRDAQAWLSPGRWLELQRATIDPRAAALSASRGPSLLKSCAAQLRDGVAPGLLHLEDLGRSNRLAADRIRQRALAQLCQRGVIVGLNRVPRGGEPRSVPMELGGLPAVTQFAPQPSRAEPSRAESSRAESSRAESSRAESSVAESSERAVSEPPAEADQASALRSTPAERPEPSQAGPGADFSNASASDASASNTASSASTPSDAAASDATGPSDTARAAPPPETGPSRAPDSEPVETEGPTTAPSGAHPVHAGDAQPKPAATDSNGVPPPPGESSETPAGRRAIPPPANPAFQGEVPLGLAVLSQLSARDGVPSIAHDAALAHAAAAEGAPSAKSVSEAGEAGEPRADPSDQGPAEATDRDRGTHTKTKPGSSQRLSQPPKANPSASKPTRGGRPPLPVALALAAAAALISLVIGPSLLQLGAPPGQRRESLQPPSAQPLAFDVQPWGSAGIPPAGNRRGALELELSERERLEVDGQPETPDAAGRVWLSPGKHSVVLRADGVERTGSIRLLRGQRLRLRR